MPRSDRFYDAPKNLTFNNDHVHLNTIRTTYLENALERLTTAIRDVESELATMKDERDPLAAHIFVSRRHYQNVNDMKSGKAPRDERPAEFQQCLRAWLCGSLDEWERLMGAVAKR